MTWLERTKALDEAATNALGGGTSSEHFDACRKRDNLLRLSLPALLRLVEAARRDADTNHPALCGCYVCAALTALEEVKPDALEPRK